MLEIGFLIKIIRVPKPFRNFPASVKNLMFYLKKNSLFFQIYSKSQTNFIILFIFKESLKLGLSYT